MDSSTTREEHLALAKERALEYVQRGELSLAVASMTSDLTKHSEFNNETTAVMSRMGIMEIYYGRDAVVSWINGFN